ncbi:glycosyltransferase family 4 protein [Helicobacter labacensis]|uniref:glycosyltransferase family 4 protein n=1 Tax=Helicobacter labacensis TaxID=2316079 RepID=UPI001F3B0481|nr:glycosyltransferase family 4 protein [Helicobacter labacensis]
MKILFTTEQYYPLQTGVSLADHGLSVALAQAGHEVLVITGARFNDQKIHREGNLKRISSGGINKDAREISPNLCVVEFDIYWDWQQGRVLGEIEEYKKFCLSFMCDLLISSGIVGKWNCDLFYDLLALCQAKKKILKSHGELELVRFCPPIKTRLKHALKFLISGFKFRPSMYILTLRRQLKSHLRHYDRVCFLHKRSDGYDYLKPYCHADILPNGVFAKDITSPKTIQAPLLGAFVPSTTQKTLETLMGDPYLLNVSNYYKEKGQDFVLRAYYLSLATIPLIFIGSLNSDNTLEDLQDLKAQLDRELGFKEVHFFYQIKREMVLTLFKQATLFLHASQQECFPMVILESMQFGTPFICTDVGNVKDLCAPLVVNTPEEMAQQINTLLGNPHQYASFSQTMHAVIQEYTYEKIVKSIEEMVEQS